MLSNANDAELKRYTYKSGAVYEGTFDGKMRSGRGHWKHPNGETYEGEYLDNKHNGLGVYIFPEVGKRYLGHWEAGKMHGVGVYYFSSDLLPFYFGNYTRDMKDGLGYYLYQTGIMTSQEWQMGKLVHEEELDSQGRLEVALKIREIQEAVRAVAPRELGEVPPPSEVRTFQFPSGATYTGQYCGTKKQGTGYWVHPEGDSYEGQFESNRHNGWGVYIIGRSGKKYVGQWRNGKMDGMGVYFFNPQETEYFVGSYSNDWKHGRGMYHFAETGKNNVQLWDGGKLVDEAPADEHVESNYIATIKQIMSLVQPYAPKYEPLFLSP